MTSDLLWLAVVVVFNALVAGIAWVNSPKARARAPQKAAGLYWRIFLFVSLWVFPIPIGRLGLELLPLNDWLEVGIMIAASLVVIFAVELLFKPYRTMVAAYREPQSVAGGAQ